MERSTFVVSFKRIFTHIALVMGNLALARDVICRHHMKTRILVSRKDTKGVGIIH